MLHKASRSFLLTGLALLALGVVSVAWPGATLALVAAVFAVVAFVVSAREFERAFSSEKAGPVVGHLALGLVDVAAGFGALLWPGITDMVLAIWIGAWALVAGAGEFALAFQSGETAGERAFFGLGGLFTTMLGLALLVRPDIGAVSLVLMVGFFSLVYGGWNIAMAVRTHKAAGHVDRIFSRTA